MDEVVLSAIIGLLATVVQLGAFIFIALVLWRVMKAHESLARSMREIANQRSEPRSARYEERYTDEVEAPE